MEAGDSLLEGEVMQVPTGHGAFFVMDVLAANGESVMGGPDPPPLSIPATPLAASCSFWAMFCSFWARLLAGVRCRMCCEGLTVQKFCLCTALFWLSIAFLT